MKTLTLTAAAAGLMLALTAAAPQDGGVEVGATPKFEFRSPLLNGKGVTSLADLRGRPTLIDFWGTR
ncbi:MAG: hypothetical protein AAF726_12090 [Planctomycetota bacterium]